MAQLAPYLDVSSARILDVGGGAGYFSEAFRARGADVILIEPEAQTPSEERDEATITDPRDLHRWLTRPGRLAPGVSRGR
jgi:hypothetical protein